MRANRSRFWILVAAAGALVLAPDSALAQGKKKTPEREATTEVKKVPEQEGTSGTIFSDAMREAVRAWYGDHPTGNVEALPPGIRMRLARGKRLPPGIAKQVAPTGLRSRLKLPDGFEVMEVGLDILLVEVATSVVHDVLRDAVR